MTIPGHCCFYCLAPIETSPPTTCPNCGKPLGQTLTGKTTLADLVRLTEMSEEDALDVKIIPIDEEFAAVFLYFPDHRDYQWKGYIRRDGRELTRDDSDRADVIVTNLLGREEPTW